MTLVALPLRPSTTANDPRPTQQRQLREWADEYDKLRQQLLAEEQELGGAESPLALLLNRIWEKARDVLGITPDAFMDWLRSEEHTSELQSLMRNSYAVLRLKKKSSMSR